MANAVMKKNARMRSGRLRANSVNRSAYFTVWPTLSSITTRSLVWLKQNTSRPKPTMA